jgi:DNA integrity scanning protein DisA with diadenylate cyclase activity
MKRRIKKIISKTNDKDPKVLESALELAMELAWEGREGRKVGTILTIGDEERVLNKSRPLILDPLLGHSEELKSVFNSDMRETIKELSLLDGAFIISDSGSVISAARYLEASSENVKLHLGLGTRHMAAAAMSLHTNTVAIVLSESSVVRVYYKGELVGKIIRDQIITDYLMLE